jgi:hypothetical protein
MPLTLKVAIFMAAGDILSQRARVRPAAQVSHAAVAPQPLAAECFGAAAAAAIGKVVRRPADRALSGSGASTIVLAVFFAVVRSAPAPSGRQFAARARLGEVSLRIMRPSLSKAARRAVDGGARRGEPPGRPAPTLHARLPSVLAAVCGLGLRMPQEPSTR